MKHFLTFLVCLIASIGYSQQIENFKIEIKGRIVEITYDLIGEEKNVTYDFNLYSSLDNYINPLKFVSGDVGIEVAPGTSKKITWNAGQELKEFNGDVYLELRGIVTPAWIRVLTPNKGDKLKPGKELSIRWDSQVERNIQIDLYKSGSFINTITTAPNTGSFLWTIPASTTKSSDYYLVFTSPAARGKQVESAQFVISKGVPIWVIAGGAVVIGGVAVIVGMGGEDPPVDEGGTTNKEINDPPRPGGN